MKFTISIITLHKVKTFSQFDWNLTRQQLNSSLLTLLVKKFKKSFYRISLMYKSGRELEANSNCSSYRNLFNNVKTSKNMLPNTQFSWANGHPRLASRAPHNIMSIINHNHRYPYIFTSNL